MKNNLIYRYKLEKKIAKLESLVLEKSVGRNGEQSNAMKIWSFLRDNGPSTSAEVKDIFPPSQRDSIASVLTNALKDDCIRRQGNKLIANLDYKWDDIGVISRRVPRELRAGDLPSDDELNSSKPSRSTRTTRSRQITPNLFSKKLEEVKAAVEAGQDVNQTNSSFLTPLAYACNSTVVLSEIVTYLLEHGANANDKVKNVPVIFLALKKGDTASAVSLVEHGADLKSKYQNRWPFTYAVDKCNITDADVLSKLVPTIIYDVNMSSQLEYIANNRSSMSGNVDVLISKILDSYDDKKFLRDMFDYSSAVADDLQEGNGVIYDKIVSCGYLPKIASINSIRSFSTDTLHKVYNTIKEAFDGKLNYQYMNVYYLLKMCDLVCSALKVPPITYDIITADLLNSYNNKKYAADIITYLIKDSNIKKIKDLAKDNLKNNNVAAEEAIGSLLRIEHTNNNFDEITVAVCRLLNKLMTSNVNLGWSIISSIQKSNNKFLIDYLFERGLDDVLAVQTYTRELSQTFIDSCREHGINLENSSTQDSVERRRNISHIVNAIEQDVWNQLLERIITQDPSILFSDEVQSALNDSKNSDSATRAQLIRRIERMPKTDDIYDM